MRSTVEGRYFFLASLTPSWLPNQLEYGLPSSEDEGVGRGHIWIGALSYLITDELGG